VAALVSALGREASSFDLGLDERRRRAERLLHTMGAGIPSLDPSLRKLPDSLRRLALEIDALWGNADGKITTVEIDRMAHLYMAAMPFFYKDARLLLKMARQLNLDMDASLEAMRATMPEVTKADLVAAKPFRALFYDAVAQAELPGAPELIRDAKQHSPQWHQLSILEHTAAAVHAAKQLKKVAGPAGDGCEATLLLHDVGKILRRDVESADPKSPRFSFWGHTGWGADWLEKRQLPPRMVELIRNHDLIRHVKSAEELIDRLGGDRDTVGALVLVYLADQAAKGGTPDQLASLAKEQPKLVALARYAGMEPDALFAAVDEARRYSEEQARLAARTDP